MSATKTVFYSWQSDTDAKVNRHFVGNALSGAIRTLHQEAVVEEALRVDQDTQGVPGQPEIFRTICEKIDRCSIFVADLTCVGVTDDGEKLPNPNVAIELGYALKAVGPERLIIVMNTAFGGPEHLPFDLRHRRWPVRYDLNPKDPPENRSRIAKDLTADLAKAIRTVVESRILETATTSLSPVGTPSTSNPAVFYDESEHFAILDHPFRQAKRLFVPQGAKIYLRLIPTRLSGELSGPDALSIVEGNLDPLRGRRGYEGVTYVRNKYGAAAINMNWETGEILVLSQLLKTREIWGIDAFSIREELIREWKGVDFGVIPSTEVEEIFDATLANYIQVAKNRLGMAPPIRFLAGLEGVADYKMGTPGGYAGRMVEARIAYESTIDNFDVPPKQLLLPFYKMVWLECGLTRPDTKPG